MSKKYEIKYKDISIISDSEIVSVSIFDDVQWKEYGVRAKNDDESDVYVFPYNSVIYVRIFEED